MMRSRRRLRRPASLQDSFAISSCAMAQALPRPTMPGTLSVPERMPRSWPPPSMMAESCTRGFLRRTYSAPTPFGPYILCAGDRHEVDVLLDHVDGDFADGLGRVGVEDYAALVTELADFGDGLDDADFVVGEHDRDQDGLVVHGALEVFEIDEAVFLHRHVSDAVAVFLQALAGVEHGFVLGDRGDDVVALLAVHFGDALDGEVVALGGAGGEDHFLGGRADQLGDALARGLHAFFGGPAEGVIAAGGIAELLHEVGQHFFQHPRVHGGGGVVIHVDGQLHALGVGVWTAWWPGEFLRRCSLIASPTCSLIVVRWNCTTCF